MHVNVFSIVEIYVDTQRHLAVKNLPYELNGQVNRLATLRKTLRLGVGQNEGARKL